MTHSNELLEELRGKSIFITGGTGFFGKWLLESFSLVNQSFELNSNIVVLTRNSQSFLNDSPHFKDDSSITYHQGDVRYFSFPQTKFDYIIHAATDADARLIAENPLQTIDTIVEGTRRILEFARFCGAKRLLMISSGAIYGKQPQGLAHIPEEYSGAPDPVHPASAYGEAKRLSELLGSIYYKKFGLETIVARPFSFVGPYLNLDVHFAIGNFIRDGLEGRAIDVNGDGTAFRSYMYASDLAEWLWTILLKGKTGQVYNVGSDQAISIKALAQLISQCFSPASEVRVLKKETIGQSIERYIPDISLAKKKLGLDCRIGLDEAIWRTIQFHRVN